MSDTPRSQPAGGSGCLSVLAIGLGVILFLPGVFAIVFLTIRGGGELGSLLLVIAIAGLALIALGADHEYRRIRARDQVDPSAVRAAGLRIAAMVVCIVLGIVAALWAAAWALLHYFFPYHF